MTDSVGLAGDGDDVDLLEELEDRFRMSLSDDEAEACVTLGDMFALIRARSPLRAASGGRCLSLMVYNRMRPNLDQGRWPDPRARLVTPDRVGAFAFEKKLATRTGLELPNLTRYSRWVHLLWLSCFAAPWAAWLVGELSVWAALGAGAAAAFAAWVVADRLDAGVLTYRGTFGDLCKSAAGRNMAMLIAEGGRWSDADAWRGMTEVTGDFTGYDAGLMRPEQRFV